MSDKIEVDRADLEAIVTYRWQGVGYEECAAAIERIRKLLEPPRCGATVKTPWNNALVDGLVDPPRCWLRKGHDGDHRVDPTCWTELVEP